MNINVVLEIGMERQEKTKICIALNVWLDDESKSSDDEYIKAICEELRNDLNSKYWDEDHRLVGRLIAETRGERVVDILDELFDGKDQVRQETRKRNQ
ncbi:MAG TPA: hypothetical protein VNH11_18540 [Pirellulales bacterium]|nr:hypothetical protein [Pirellulales bacterium]